MEVCQPCTYTNNYSERGLLLLASHNIVSVCVVPTPYVLIVLGGKQLSLHNTNGLVDTHTNTCTQIKSTMPRTQKSCRPLVSIAQRRVLLQQGGWVE